MTQSRYDGPDQAIVFRRNYNILRTQIQNRLVSRLQIVSCNHPYQKCPQRPTKQSLKSHAPWLNRVSSASALRMERRSSTVKAAIPDWLFRQSPIFQDNSPSSVPGIEQIRSIRRHSVDLKESCHSQQKIACLDTSTGLPMLPAISKDISWKRSSS